MITDELMQNNGGGADTIENKFPPHEINPTSVLPNLTFPAVPSHNISTYRTHNVSGFLDKPIIDKAIHGPSKILSRKWREKDMDRHRMRLAEMKAITNNQPNPNIVINKGKNEQLLEDRYTEIERENRLLFEKITHIHLKGGGVPLAP